MSDTRCEPVDTTRDGWHWVQWRNHDRVLWWGGGEWTIIGITGKARGVFPQQAADLGYRYLAPVTPPAVVAGLVEALEPFAVAANLAARGGRPPWEFTGAKPFEVAAAALAAYRGQA